MSPRLLALAAVAALSCAPSPRTVADADACSGAIEPPYFLDAHGQRAPPPTAHFVPTPPPPREPFAYRPALPLTSIGVDHLFAEAPRGRTSSSDVLLMCRISVDDARRYDAVYEVGRPLTLGIVSAKIRFEQLAHFELAIGGKPAHEVAEDLLKNEKLVVARVDLSPKSRVAWTIRWDQTHVLGPLAASYDGELPLSARGHGFEFECRGWDAAARARERARLEALVDAKLASSTRDRAWIDQLTDAQARLAALAGEDDARVKQLAEAIGHARQDDLERAPRAVERLRREATPLATWAPVDDTLEARTTGVMCFRGGFLACNVALEVRARAPNATLCPYEMDVAGPLRFAAYFGDGLPTPLTPEAIWHGGRYVARREALRRLAPGDVYLVELGFHGFVPYADGGDRPTDWNVPVIEVESGGQRRAFRTY